jgi:hypothetical protein
LGGGGGGVGGHQGNMEKLRPLQMRPSAQITSTWSFKLTLPKGKICLINTFLGELNVWNYMAGHRFVL